MPYPCRLVVQLPAALVGVVALTLPAAAQQQVGSNGRALDANPGVGTGGNNRVENQVDYAARNDLVTGNVAGGFGFQGLVDYGAPGEFRGGLGSEDLFNFRAESLGSAPAAARQPSLFNPAFRGPASGGNVVVYNDFTAIPGGRLVQNANTRVAPSGGDFRVTNRPGQTGPYQFQPDPSTGIALQTRNPGNVPNNLGITRTPDGTALAVSADPLTGVTRRALPPAARNDVPVTAPLRQGPGEPGAPGFRTVPDLRRQSTSNYQSPTTPNDRDRLIQGPADNAELRERFDFADATGKVKPTLQLGRLNDNFATTNPTTMEQRVARLQDQIFGRATTNRPPGSTEPTENAYTQLLERIKAQAESDAAQRTAAAETTDLRPEWMKAMDEPEEEEVRRVEETLEQTLERIRTGLEDARRQREAAEGGTPGLAGTQAEVSPEEQSRRDAADARLNALMDDLTYNVRLETLVAQREGRLNDLLAEAETQMAEGKFLNAERTYRQVRLEATDNPLGEVGMVHAQLGAGMIRSAAFNLRGLFEEHPELIATRYGEDLLPPAERLEWLQKELQRIIDADASSLEPGLMMAYLGHQVESRQLVRYGLAIAEDAAPYDQLIPVLRRIWLDGGGADEADAGQ
jgi:hypothetical protein